MKIDDRFLKTVNDKSMLYERFFDAIEKSMIDFEIDHRFPKSLTKSLTIPLTKSLTIPTIVNDFVIRCIEFVEIVNDLEIDG